MSAAANALQTEVVIIGAGPCGLFQVFELGLLGIKAHIVDSLKTPGGQCTELYPDKPIYDIPAIPVCGAQELVDRLLQQIKPFDAAFHLGEEVVSLAKRGDGRFDVATAAGTRFDAGAVVIAGGVGSFQPRRLAAEGADSFEGRQLHYRVKNAADFHGKELLILGGGDSALDWAIDFADKARVTLVHRRADFRGAPASAARVKELAAAGRIRHFTGNVTCAAPFRRAAHGRRAQADRRHAAEVAVRSDPGLLRPASKARADRRMGTRHRPEGDPGRYGKVSDEHARHLCRWRHQHLPGKKKLILSGFHEAALAAFAVQNYLYPDKKQFLQYTTTSPIMQKRLGVASS